jgi:hypothetical protein
VTAALALPALAVATTALYRRWQIVGLAAVALVLVGVPSNVARTIDYSDRNPFTLGTPETVLGLVSIPSGLDAPRELRPLGSAGEDVTMGWLQDGVRSGKVPALTSMDRAAVARAEWALSLQQTDEPLDAVECEALARPVVRELAAGDEIHLQSGRVHVANPSRPLFKPFTFDAAQGNTVRALADGAVELRPDGLPGATVLCE